MIMLLHVRLVMGNSVVSIERPTDPYIKVHMMQLDVSFGGSINVC